jgi:penicillin-binding protein 2
MEIKDYLRESRRFGRRAIVSGVIVVALVATLIGRMVYLQILHHEHYRSLSQENRVKLLPVPPTRGLVYDRNGVILAENRPGYSLVLVPEQIKDLDRTLAELGAILPITEQDLERFHQLKRQYRRFESIPLLTNLSDETAAIFASNRYRFPGVDIEAQLIRHYPHGELTAHVLGYVGRISKRDLEQISASNYAGTSHIGKIGVEKPWADALHGSVGTQEVEVNALGRAVRVLSRQPPQPGRNLRLHLDVRLQEVAMAAFGEETGALVAIEPETGGVLALVSNPGYDPNPFVNGISNKAYQELRDADNRPLYNRTLRGQYPPGSTVKPFMGLAGLETGTTSSSEVRYCPGFYRLPGHSHRYRDWKKTGHGPVALDMAITRSCDVYFYDLAHSMGIDKMHDYLGQFGFGAPTGVDLTDEMGGLLPSREWKRRARNQAWYPGETLIAGIGQGYFLATPLQLAAATATFANGGDFRPPRVVEEIRDPDGSNPVSTLAEAKPIAKVNLTHWQEVKEAMLHVVEHPAGTAKRIRTDHYRIAGKTGTAQVFTVKQDEEYDEEGLDKKLRDHALFIAYAPAENPKIAVAVIVENGGHGGSTAAPIARKVLDAYLLGDGS